MTQVVATLGLALPVSMPDPSSADNPDGYFESTELYFEVMNPLLAGVGAWPEETLPRVIPLPSDPDTYRHAADVFKQQFPEEPWVWKDPRLCGLLPFWRKVWGERQPLAVFVFRDPVETTRSMRLRDPKWKVGERMTPKAAAAIWERNIRHALGGLEGMRTIAVSYGSLLEEPLRQAARIVDFAARHGMKLPRDRIGAAANTVNRGYRRCKATDGAEEPLSPEQVELWRRLQQLDGRAFDSFESPRLGPETPGNDDHIDDMRAKSRMHRDAELARSQAVGHEQ